MRLAPISTVCCLAALLSLPVVPPPEAFAAEGSRATLPGIGDRYQRRERPEMFNVQKYGAVADGVTDDSQAVLEAIADAARNHGGIVYFPPGTYLIRSQIALPTDGARPPQQKSLRLTGAGPSHNGSGSHRWSNAPRGGSVLDLRYSGPVAKIDTRGLGFLEIDRLTLKDDGVSSTPFIHTTNTTLHVHRVEFYGNPSKSQRTCDQDAIVLGGTGTDLTDGAAEGPFQGYGTVIEGNYFNRIRRGVHMRTHANGIVVRDNTWWNNCGSNLPGGAALEMTGIPSSYCAGNVVTGNLIEMGGYAYGIRADYTVNSSFIANNFYDSTPGVLGYIHFGPDAEFNLVIEGFHEDAYPGVVAARRGVNTVLTSHQSRPTQFTQPVEFSDERVISTAGQGIVKQDAAGNEWYERMLSANRLEFMYTPAGGSPESIAGLIRGSTSQVEFRLAGPVSSLVHAPRGQLRLLSGIGEELVLGDNGNQDLFVLGGTLHSRKATGAPPFVVESTTPVENLTVRRGESFAIGGGTPIRQVVARSATIDFPAVAARRSADVALTVAGAVPGAVITLGVPPAAALPDSSFSAWASGPDEVTVRFNNYSDRTQDPPAGAFTIMVTAF